MALGGKPLLHRHEDVISLHLNSPDAGESGNAVCRIVFDLKVSFKPILVKRSTQDRRPTGMRSQRSRRRAQYKPSFNHSVNGRNDMGYVTTSDGVEIFYKDWGPKTARLSTSTTAGRCPAMTGMPRCCSS